MIPQIAHHPRYSSQRFGDPRFAVLPFDPITTPRQPDQIPPLPLQNSQSIGFQSTLVPHHTYHVENHDSHGHDRSRGLSQALGRRYNDPAEHMLRRKTPNGTLAAGYDGTPVQWSSKVPSLKHVVLPMSELSIQQSSCLPSSIEDPQNLRKTGGSDWIHQREGLNINSRKDDSVASSTCNRAHPLSTPDSARSIRENVRTHYKVSGCYNTEFQVPTVLQPFYQPSPGPTASNDGGLYGPYWPDGKFVPYKPSAVRFQQNDHLGYNNHGTVPIGDPRPHVTSISHPLPPVRQLSVSCLDTGFNLRHASPALHHSNNPVGVVDKCPNIPEPCNNLHTSLPIFSSASAGPHAPNMQSLGKESNPKFKEKSLSWAHGIYMDLLAFLHHSRKESNQARHLQGSRAYSQSFIYPKPPRQPGLQLGSSYWYYSNANENGSAKIHPNITSSSPQVTSPIPITEHWQSSADFGETHHVKFASHDIPHYVSSVQNSLPQSNGSPLSKAKEALEMLTNLCDQSGWRWIDGMLLGGCLAYGLEDYHAALEWYSKIVAFNPKNVEAISNLAATLLCLNRREEAEQYWLHSVKLRPSYFEAVEHLIGLLCGDHRGQEAINIIEFVERSLRLLKSEDLQDPSSETSSDADRDSCESLGISAEAIAFDYDVGVDISLRSHLQDQEKVSMLPGFASSGFSISGSDNGRILALVHAKGNMLYALGNIDGAAKAFEDAVLISVGKDFRGIRELIRNIIDVLSLDEISPLRTSSKSPQTDSLAPLLLPPEKALQTAKFLFTKNGELPGLRYVSDGLAKRTAISTTSNSLLSLAKIFQDAMSNSSSRQRLSRKPTGVGDILALYYLSLSLQPSPSTANNVGILLASVQQTPAQRLLTLRDGISAYSNIPGVIPGSCVALALAYYNYGLNLDSRHAHIYTNLGSLLKDIGQLAAAITMYERAVVCDGTFDIALANLANAVKDQGRTSDAIHYYRRAVASSPDFAEAVCGLANALNSVCDWAGRGGVLLNHGNQDRWHVDEMGMILDGRSNGYGSGWMKRVVDIVEKQLKDGSTWGRGSLEDHTLHHLLRQLEATASGGTWTPEKRANLQATFHTWVGSRWEGSRIVRLIERAVKNAMHRWYVDKYVKNRHLPSSHYPRPQLPTSLAVPSAPTVLPFHTFTCPLSAKNIRMISQRNALRISCSTMRMPWMQGTVFTPPPPPNSHLNVGYVSSDFNNHPLSHLMQSVFGMHDISRVKAFCYATTASDNSAHRRQIEREAPVFRDVNSWSADQLVQQIVLDEIHILVNLNGYTRGARNEVFAARPAPIQMSFMGFAGTLGAEWCDYLLADETAIPPDTLRPWRRNLDIEDQVLDEKYHEDEDWVYSENIIFCRDTFFCCDHAQSEPDEKERSWDDEQSRRWIMRKELFPSLSDDAVILGNFNQLYKIEPATFRTWLRILDKVPNAILWLLRFPDLGEANLKRTAHDWAGESVASRIWFTDVAPKHQHISRARVCDLFLDTPECNAHTTAADVLWSCTPLLTLPRYKYKMCSRMAASILKGALPKNDAGQKAAQELIAENDDQYEEFAINLASGLTYRANTLGYAEGVGRLSELRKLLYHSRWNCALFDTRRWVTDLESAYEEAWRRWVANEGGDIYL